MSGITLTVEGIPEVQEMLDQYRDRLMDAHLKAAVRAAALVYREEVPKAAPKLVGPKLRPISKSEHEGPPFWADVTPANNIWNMYEKGRKGGYSIPAVRVKRPRPLNVVLANIDGSFGPVTGPVYGGAMAPRPFLSAVFEANVDRAAEEGINMLMSFAEDGT